MILYPEIFNKTGPRIKLLHEESELRTEIIAAITGAIFVGILHKNYNQKLCNELTKKFKFPKLHLVLTSLLLLFVFPVIATFSFIFCIYKYCIKLILILKHKSKFRGFLSGADTFWLLNDESSNVINILLIISSKKSTSSSDLKHAILCRLKNILSQPECAKMLCKSAKFMGYSYLINDEIDIEDRVRDLHIVDYSDRQRLETKLGQLASLHLQDGKLWEVLVGNESFNWGNISSSYPVIVRFNHSLGDGLALMQLLLACFGVSDLKPQVPENDDVFMQTMIKISIRLMHFMVVIASLPSFIYKKIVANADNNVLHGRRLSGQKIVAWRNEETSKYVKMVKGIKNMQFGAGFFDIVAAAVSASLGNFYEQKCNNMENITTIIPAVPNSLPFKNMNHPRINLVNMFSVGVLELPIKRNNETKKYRVIDRLGNVMENIFELKKSMEYQINYWFINIFASILPEYFIKLIISQAEHSMVISNLPGPNKMCFIEDRFLLEDLIFWVPHRATTGVSMSIFTYDDRFQLGLLIDEAYGVSKLDAQMILDGIFKFINYLEYECTMNG